jgi:hypothetical protein
LKNSGKKDYNYAKFGKNNNKLAEEGRSTKAQ